MGSHPGGAHRGDRERAGRKPADRAGHQPVRRPLLIAAASAVVSLVVFANVPASSTAAVALIHGYRRTLSPVADKLGARCRFIPTCSRYAEIVIHRDGVVRGGWETVRRILRCNPSTPVGTRDLP